MEKDQLRDYEPGSVRTSMTASSKAPWFFTTESPEWE
jgi:hypothetical protein